MKFLIAYVGLGLLWTVLGKVEDLFKWRRGLCPRHSAKWRYYGHAREGHSYACHDGYGHCSIWLNWRKR